MLNHELYRPLPASYQYLPYSCDDGHGDYNRSYEQNDDNFDYADYSTDHTDNTDNTDNNFCNYGKKKRKSQKEIIQDILKHW